MTRRDDLKLSHGAAAKVRENAVKQDRVNATNAIGYHPERPRFLRRTEFIGGTGNFDLGNPIEARRSASVRVFETYPPPPRHRGSMSSSSLTTGTHHSIRPKDV